VSEIFRLTAPPRRSSRALPDRAADIGPRPRNPEGDRAVEGDCVGEPPRPAARGKRLGDREVRRDVPARDVGERRGLQAQGLRGPFPAHRPQAPDAAHEVVGRRCELVDPLARRQDPVDGKSGRCPQRLERVRELLQQGGRGRAEDDAGGPPRVQERPEDVEDCALAPSGQKLADGSDAPERGMPCRGEEEGVAERAHRLPQAPGGRLQVDTERRKEVGASALRGDPAVAVLHDGHAGARHDKRDEARDVEAARVIPPGPDDVDGPRRPLRHAGVGCESAEHLGEARHLGRCLALPRQRREKLRLHLVGGPLRGEERGGSPDLVRVHVASRGERPSQDHKVGHVSTPSRQARRRRRRPRSSSNRSSASARSRASARAT
jgi:hypothetical protein